MLCKYLLCLLRYRHLRSLMKNLIVSLRNVWVFYLTAVGDLLRCIFFFLLRPHPFHTLPFFQLGVWCEDEPEGSSEEVVQTFPVHHPCKENLQRAAAAQTHEAWKCKSPTTRSNITSTSQRVAVIACLLFSIYATFIVHLKSKEIVACKCTWKSTWGLQKDQSLSWLLTISLSWRM